KLIVRSNPFTPNGDGINDDAYFFCKEFKLELPSIKLFDLRGRFVRQLTELDSESRFRWDGRDENGADTMPGVYLFILQDKGESIMNGCVVIAR
ncbi:gliding motility-associated C-terminal domain-containing protein, partial [candidate division KSB1 bacterium]|nr:gliding motility-associated C-terminal domain-containing protein [candidate division KSB1 bacterium]